MQLPPHMIPGSWEARTWEAGQLLQADDPQGLELALKLIARLSSFNAAQLDAGDGLLKRLHARNTRNAVDYLVYHGRYPEAVELHRNLLDDIAGWFGSATLVNARASLLRLAGDEPAALDLWSQWHTAESRPKTPMDWFLYINTMAEWGRVEDAERALPEFERVATAYEQNAEQAMVAPQDDDLDDDLYDDFDEESDEEAADTLNRIATMRADILWIRARMAADQGRWSQAAAHFHAALRSEASAYANWQVVGIMLSHGEIARAEELINKARDESPMCYYLRGVAAHRRGKLKKARFMWEAAVLADAPEEFEEAIDFCYSAYALFALGDEQGGLKLALTALRGPYRNNWPLLVAAAIGWARRGNLQTALTNLQHAVRIQRKDTYVSHLLPASHWFFVSELLSPDQQEAFRPFFEPSTPPTPGP